MACNTGSAKQRVTCTTHAWPVAQVLAQVTGKVGQCRRPFDNPICSDAPICLPVLRTVNVPRVANMNVCYFFIDLLITYLALISCFEAFLFFPLTLIVFMSRNLS